MEMLTRAEWLSIAGPILSAVTAVIGVRFGLFKMRSERALDRRLEWHERAVRELVRLQLIVSTLDSALRLAPAKATAVVARMEAQNEQLEIALAERYLYATPPSSRAIEDLLDELTKFGNGEHSISNRESLKALIAVIGKVLPPLAHEMRKELGWEPLPSDGVTMRHLGSDPE